MSSQIQEKTPINPMRTYSPAVLELHWILKCLSKCHVVVALVMLILGLAADYVSYRVNTVRLHGVAEVGAVYFLLMGIIGICGSASHRRGLIIAFMLMGLHSTFIFAPIVIIVSSFDIHFYNHECWGMCDWTLLSPSLPRSVSWLFKKQLTTNSKCKMSRLGTDYRIDAGLITLSIIEFLLSIVTTILCFKQIFGFMSMEKCINPTSNVELMPLNDKDGKSPD